MLLGIHCLLDGALAPASAHLDRAVAVCDDPVRLLVDIAGRLAGVSRPLAREYLRRAEARLDPDDEELAAQAQRVARRLRRAASAGAADSATRGGTVVWSMDPPGGG